ncbi:hypothetical protein CN198_14330 [Sinorhizobium meliloti]|uniref:hypothetical protein n=1 Tax=Rhizobium meliloti TaxID=382 RepID=UPI000FD7F864|nr:hypothetical protein [Sinorhizobium meliloti]RVH69232.1 hypothetical protein CN198_14330 [Sinorhizobium meliloti]
MMNAISGAATLGILLFNPVTISVAGGIAWNHDFQKATLVDFHEANYAEVCPVYRDALTWDRWFDSRIRNKSWCEGYLDRI